MQETTFEKKESMDERQVVVFNLSKEEFGVNINEVREIVRMEQITKIPNTEQYIKGVINLRGGIIVIIDLATKLGLAAKDADKNTRIIVIEMEKNTVGMVVDSATEVLRINEDKIQPPPKIIEQKINADYIEGVGILGERLLILLDLVKVLEAKDIEHIQNVQSLVNKQKETKEKKVQEKPKEISAEPVTPAPEEKPAEAEEKKEEASVEAPAATAPIEEEEHPVLKDVHDDFHFITHEGKPLKNVTELSEYVKNLDEDNFRNYVNEEKNDFYQWVKNSVKDEELAEKIKQVKSKQDVSKEIIDKIKSIS